MVFMFAFELEQMAMRSGSNLSLLLCVCLQWRHGVVEAVYESRPQAADHKVGGIASSNTLS